MFTTMHWLPNRRAAWRTNSGLRQAAELIETLSRPGVQQRPDVVDRADSTPHGQGHEDHLGRAADHVEHDVAAFVAGRDVEKDQLVGPFLLVPRGHLDRIAGIAEIEEIRSLHHPPAIHVEAGNHAFGKHILVGCVKRTFVLAWKIIVHFMHSTRLICQHSPVNSP